MIKVGLKEGAKMSRGAPLKGWRFGAFVGSIAGAIGLAIYPIIIRYAEFRLS